MEDIISKHSDSCIDLANLKRTIYINVPLGSVWGAQFSRSAKSHEIFREMWEGGERDMGKINKVREEIMKDMGVPIADVVVIRKSYTQFCIDIYDVKVSRSDFLKSKRTEKWRKYLPYCNRFYFAIESGFAHREEIPEEIGLIVKGKRGWNTIKRAKERDILIPYETLMSLLFYRQKKKYAKQGSKRSNGK